jgi:hypothetical protein
MLLKGALGLLIGGAVGFGYHLLMGCAGST